MKIKKFSFFIQGTYKVQVFDKNSIELILLKLCVLTLTVDVVYYWRCNMKLFLKYVSCGFRIA